MLGVWSVAHGQLLQSLAADSGLEAQAPKAKGSPFLNGTLPFCWLWGQGARLTSPGGSNSSWVIDTE